MLMFDLSQYFPAPNLDTESFVTLADVMLGNVPSPAPALVEQAAASLRVAVDQTRAALLDRFEEDLGIRRLRDFDPFADAVWERVAGALGAHALYLHPGLAEFDDSDRAAIDYERRVELAHKAAKAEAKLFASGTDFLRSPYPQQLTQMATRLTWLVKHADELELPALIGEDLFELVSRTQVRYAALVHERSAQTGRSLVDLRELRGELRRQLYNYVGTVGGMASTNDPVTVAAVEDALRPLLIARKFARSRSTRKNGEPEPFGEVLEELLAAEGEGGDASEEITLAGVVHEPEPEPEPAA
jgi:hypothetical protein